SCQYSQMKVLSNGDMIILANFTENITYYDGKNYISLSDKDKSGNITYQYFICRMTSIPGSWATTKWIKRISAGGLQNLSFSVKEDVEHLDDIYLVGTYEGSLSVTPSSIMIYPMTNLPNDMFIAKLSPNTGDVIWIKTSYKINTSSRMDSTTGYVRALSVSVQENFI